ncbi:hypothetical protein TEA_019323 [Camellia sinensis var. sinensis]|uniref:Thioredoxin domain-containing protein n=1 Tax=Camellia sinensis var. sinensis TaxID=542762 RepID=A0A4S4ER12_CAMSN|nr:hypothetical protein TEA_019323 [Camellia sinensis var. sinensis]
MKRHHHHHCSVILISLLVVVSNLLTVEAEVITLTADTFNDKVKEKDTAWFVQFCVPWCKHCKKLGSLWEDLGKAMEGEDEIEIGQVDCGTDKPVCNKVDIHSYPTFKLFYNGEEVAKYQGTCLALPRAGLRDLLEVGAAAMGCLNVCYLVTHGRTSRAIEWQSNNERSGLGQRTEGDEREVARNEHNEASGGDERGAARKEHDEAMKARR